MAIQLIVSLFALFAITRVWLRYRDGSIGLLGMSVWGLLWLAITGFVWWPGLSDIVAHSVGVGRGVDAIVYISIVALFYGLFRLYVRLEFVEHELTSLVRSLALRDKTKRDL